LKINALIRGGEIAIVIAVVQVASTDSDFGWQRMLSKVVIKGSDRDNPTRRKIHQDTNMVVPGGLDKLVQIAAQIVCHHSKLPKAGCERP
jgi:hypothetical protein